MTDPLLSQPFSKLSLGEIASIPEYLGLDPDTATLPQISEAIVRITRPATVITPTYRSPAAHTPILATSPVSPRTVGLTGATTQSRQQPPPASERSFDVEHYQGEVPYRLEVTGQPRYQYGDIPEPFRTLEDMSSRGQKALTFLPEFKRGLFWILPQDDEEASDLLRSAGYRRVHPRVVEKDWGGHPLATSAAPPRLAVPSPNRAVPTTTTPRAILSHRGRGGVATSTLSRVGQAVQPQPALPSSRSFSVAKDRFAPVYTLEVKGFPRYRVLNPPEPFRTLDSLNTETFVSLGAGPPTANPGTFSILPQHIKGAVDLLRGAGYQWTNPSELGTDGEYGGTESGRGD